MTTSRKSSSRTSNKNTKTKKTSQHNSRKSYKKPRSSSAKTSINKFLKSKVFKESFTDKLTDEILNEALDIEEVADFEEKRISEIKPKMVQDLKSIETALRKHKHGGIILFGDPHHGDLIFDFIIKVFPSLNKSLQTILKNASYFSENAYQMNELKKRNYGQKFIGLDDNTTVNMDKYDELKRNHQANVTWSNIILNNLTNNLTIISVGRSHLYTIRGKKETSRLETISSFQDVLKEKTHKQITVFTMNNDFDLRYDNYKDYAKTHQLDDVIDDPKIRSIFVM